MFDSLFKSAVFRFYSESPRAYIMVFVVGFFSGLIEFFGLISVIPVISLYLGELTEDKIPLQSEFILSFEPLYILFFYFFVVVVQTFLLYGAEAYFLKKMAEWRTGLSLDYVRNILRADFENFQTLGPGEAEVVITRNVGFAVRNRHRVAIFITEVALSSVYMGIALWISWATSILFAVIALLYGGISFIALKYRIARSKVANSKYISAARILSQYIVDFRALQVFGNLRNLEDKIEDDLNVASVAQRQNDNINAAFRIVTQPLLIILLLVGVFAAKSFMDVANSELLLILYVFFRSAPRLLSAIRTYGDMRQDLPMEVTDEIIQWSKKVRKVDSGNKFPAELKSNVFSLDQVSYSYGERRILSNVTLSVSKGELVVLTGKSGSGKSTILDLGCGFLRPDQGSIVLCGEESPWTSSFDDILRPFVSIVRPDAIVVEGSFSDNVAFLDSVADLEKVSGLLRLVGLSEQGFSADSPIEPRGCNLSSGQKQRLIIARALYKDPVLLILDEPTSNLDISTERHINNLMLLLKDRCSLLVVSHRESIHPYADKIYSLSDGICHRLK